MGKARALTLAAARLIRARSSGDLTLVHRLGFLTPIPGVEPPRALDIYDFDDALYLGSIGLRIVLPGRSRTKPGHGGNCQSCASSSCRQRSSRTNGQPRDQGSCGDCAVLRGSEGYRIRQHRQGEVLTAGWVGSGAPLRICRRSFRRWSESIATASRSSSRRRWRPRLSSALARGESLGGSRSSLTTSTRWMSA